MYVKIDYLKDIKGVIHCGGNTAEEYELYDSLGIKDIVWIEAIEESAEKIAWRFRDNKDIIVLNECISDKEEKTTFNITNNLASSSLLELGTHKIEHPKIHVDNIIDITPVRLDTLIENGTIDISKYNFLNADVQGAELKVLRSLGKYLNNFDYLYLEVNIEELYKKCALMHEIDDYLKDYKLADIHMTRHGWGDALYIKI